jgi:hypothetical protein
MSRGTKCANAEPAKTNIETPKPSPRKVIIALEETNRNRQEILAERSRLRARMGLCC